MKDKDADYLVSQLNSIIARYEQMFADVEQARDTINQYVERINDRLDPDGVDAEVEIEEDNGDDEN